LAAIHIYAESLIAPIWRHPVFTVWGLNVSSLPDDPHCGLTEVFALASRFLLGSFLARFFGFLWHGFILQERPVFTESPTVLTPNGWPAFQRLVIFGFPVR
jgi:hypothetical protein